MGQGELFPGSDYEDVRPESLGEHPDLKPEQIERGIDNYALVLGGAVLSGEIDAQDAYYALTLYEEDENARKPRDED